MRWVKVLVPTGAAVVLASAVAVAASGGDSVNGCVTSSGKNKGELRVLTGSSTKCAKGETAISWSKTGPQGSVGARGDAGPKGDTGPAGPQGAASTPESLLFGGEPLSDPSVDAYVKFDGTDGESTVAGYERQSAVRSFRMSLDQELPPGGVGGSGKGKSTLDAIHFTKVVDKSSPVVARMGVTGKHLPVVAFSFVKPTPGGPREFMTVTLKDVLVTHWQLGGEREPSSIERIDLAPRDMEIQVRPIDGNGNLGTPSKFGWNLITTETR